MSNYIKLIFKNTNKNDFFGVKLDTHAIDGAAKRSKPRQSHKKKQFNSEKNV